MDGTGLTIYQETEYPWDGKIKIIIDPEKDKMFTINIRIPGWALEEVVPGGLYRYLGKNEQEVTLKVNGESLDFIMNKGFAAITRRWSKGDIIELVLPVVVRRVLANQEVKDDLNKVALVRGPIVYCAEGVDNDTKVLQLVIPDNVGFKTEYRQDLLNGLVVIKGEVLDKSGKERELLAIPYYAWSHRGPGEMAVWLSRK